MQVMDNNGKMTSKTFMAKDRINHLNITMRGKELAHYICTTTTTIVVIIIHLEKITPQQR